MGNFAVALCVSLSLLILGGCAASTFTPPVSLQPSTLAPTAAARRVVDAPRPDFLSPRNGGSQWTVAPDSTLIAVSRLYGTAFGAVTPDYKVSLSPSSASVLDKAGLSRGGGRLAYLVMPGIDPGEDYIQLVGLPAGKAQMVNPAKGFAIFGFALEPGGNNLVFSEAALAGASSTRVPWNVSVASLQSGEVKQLLSSDMAPGLDETVPVPIAWSRTAGEIYLNAIRPFRGGGGKGVWAMRPDGAGLRQLLTEDKFVGTPLLSFDGSRLAYLASDQELLPTGFIAGPGEPPGNVVMIKDLNTGEERIAVQEKGRAIGAVSWAENGDSLVLSRRDWVDTALQDTDVSTLSLRDSTERQLLALPKGSRVTDILEDIQGSLLWVNATPAGTALVYSDGSAASTTILTVQQGQIKVVGRVD